MSLTEDKIESFASQKETLLYFHYYRWLLSFSCIGDVTWNLSDFIGREKNSPFPLDCRVRVLGKLQQSGESAN